MTATLQSRTFRLAAVLATTLAAAGASQAQTQAQAPTGGLYASAALGFNELETETITGVGAPFGPQPGGNTRSDRGGAAVLGLGWKFNNGLRAELEGAYRRNSIHRATAGALKEAEATGKETKESLFANVLYDFGSTDWGVKPYVGVGVGRTRARWDELYLRQRDEVVHFDDAQRSTSYQFIAGATFLDQFAPGFSLTVEYRYIGNEGVTHSGRVEQSRFGAFPVTAKLSSTRDQSLLLGVRYRFNGLN